MLLCASVFSLRLNFVVFNPKLLCFKNVECSNKMKMVTIFNTLIVKQIVAPKRRNQIAMLFGRKITMKKDYHEQYMMKDTDRNRAYLSSYTLTSSVSQCGAGPPCLLTNLKYSHTVPANFVVGLEV